MRSLRRSCGLRCDRGQVRLHRGRGRAAYDVIVGRFAYIAVAVAVAVVLCAFGAVAILSIGAPFFLTGAAMLAVSPWRRRRDVVWAAIAAPWVFTAVYGALAPISCTTTAASGPLLLGRPRVEAR